MKILGSKFHTVFSRSLQKEEKSQPKHSVKKQTPNPPVDTPLYPDTDYNWLISVKLTIQINFNFDEKFLIFSHDLIKVYNLKKYKYYLLFINFIIKEIRKNNHSIMFCKIYYFFNKCLFYI